MTDASPSTARVAVVVGNPKEGSRTLHAARAVARALTAKEPDVVIDLVELGPALLDWSAPNVAEAVKAVASADLMIVASPTFKATYTGLLKLFLDRLSAGSLTRVVAVPLMLGGDWRHSLAPEAFLKPVLAEIGASTPTRGLFLLDSDYAESTALHSWLEVARTQLPERVLSS